MDELRKAIKITEEYGEKYGGWTHEQVMRRLISAKELTIKESTANKIENKCYREKMIKAQRLAKKYLLKMNDILMVGVTGSVAAENPKENDDIDLMIVTKQNKLWLTRIKWWWRVNRQGIPHRRPMTTGKSDEFCFNLWLDEEALEMPKKKQNLRNAMDLILMKPILNRDKTYERLVAANKWAGNYVRNGYNKLRTDVKTRTTKKMVNWGETAINWLLFMGQYCYMKRKIKGELVDLHRAFFHPGD